MRRTLGTAALAACAGAVDLLALTTLGGAFAGIITGNLVTIGYGLGDGNGPRVISVAVAVAGFTAGVAAFGWARRATLTALLCAELALLAVVAAGLLATGVRPGPVAARVLLAVAAAAMGGQSLAALRLGASTTYLTGALATALRDAAAGHLVPLRPALIQLSALVAGSALTAALLAHLRPAAALMPPLLLAAAITMLRTGS